MRELTVFVSKLKQKYFSKNAVASGKMKIFGKKINETEINGKEEKMHWQKCRERSCRKKVKQVESSD